jgi:hypothetical protein
MERQEERRVPAGDRSIEFDLQGEFDEEQLEGNDCLAQEYYRADWFKWHALSIELPVGTYRSHTALSLAHDKFPLAT